MEENRNHLSCLKMPVSISCQRRVLPCCRRSWPYQGAEAAGVKELLLVKTQERGLHHPLRGLAPSRMYRLAVVLLSLVWRARAPIQIQLEVGASLNCLVFPSCNQLLRHLTQSCSILPTYPPTHAHTHACTPKTTTNIKKLFQYQQIIPTSNSHKHIP